MSYSYCINKVLPAVRNYVSQDKWNSKLSDDYQVADEITHLK